jgi:hypothetical protein
MNKEFIPYEQAVELKELGFDESFLGYYRNVDRSLFTNNKVVDPFYDTIAPLYQQAFRFFREKYGIFGNVTYMQEFNYVFNIGNIPDCDYLSYGQDYNTYEEAELACLKKLIEIVKEKK